MRLFRILVSVDAYGKHYDSLTETEKEGVLEIAAAFAIRNEKTKQD